VDIQSEIIEDTIYRNLRSLRAEMAPTETKPTTGLRILQIIASLDPASGGPAESVRRIVSNYAPLGNAGEVVCLDDPSAPFLREMEITVHALGPHHLKYCYTPRLKPWLEANAHRFDGVIIHGLWQYHGLAAMQTFKGRKPYAVLVHGMLDPWFKQAYPMKHLKKWLYWLLVEYWVLRGAYRVLFTTAVESQMAEASFWMHRWHGEVIPYGAQLGDGEPEDMMAAFYKIAPQLKGKKFLLFLGRIHPKKGCDMLLEAFAKISRQAPDLHLVFAGPDQTGWRTELEARSKKLKIDDRVHWPGMVRGDAKWGGFYACEAFVLPSHQENFGIAVAEALACSKPVLIADKVNICDAIVQDQAGLVEPDTPEGTLNLLTRWLATPQSERDAMGRNAQICFTRRFDMRENARQIVRMFAEVARSNNRRASATEAPAK
jgi:glycosyltransferase involved in cell wall biosynthesis